jgi:hypothetical protein
MKPASVGIDLAKRHAAQPRGRRSQRDYKLADQTGTTFAPFKGLSRAHTADDYEALRYVENGDQAVRL